MADKARVVLDVVAGLLVSIAAGLWLTRWNVITTTTADALFLPALLGDIWARGFGVLPTWHWASSSYAFPDCLLFFVAWAFAPHYARAIPLYAGLITAASILALWLVIRPTHKRVSFAAFSLVFVILTGVLLVVLSAVSSTKLLAGWYSYLVLSVHHYGNVVNTLLALGAFLWWRRLPSVRRSLVLASLVLFFVLCDVMFLVTFVAPALLVDVWLNGPSVVATARARRWPYALFITAALLGLGIDAKLNPLSPLRAVGEKMSVRSALAHFIDVRFGTMEQRLETLVRVICLLCIVIIAVRSRRAASESHASARTATVHGFLVLSIGCSVASAIVTGKYQGKELDRYVLPLGFFPLFGALGAVAIRAASALPLRLSLPAAIGALAAATSSARMAHATQRFESLAPPMTRCLDELGLAGTAGVAPYWLTKPLIVIGERRVQVVQLAAGGGLYGNLVNDRWAAEDWFENRSMPAFRFALMAADEHHARMLEGSETFIDDGLVLEPTSIRRLFGVPETVRRCEGATFWIYRDGALAGLEPLPLAGLAPLPLRLRATHPQLRQGHGFDEGTSVRATGEEGTVVFGPYVTLLAGAYRVRWFGRRLGNEGRIGFEVTAVGESVALATLVMSTATVSESRAEMGRLDFTLQKSTAGIETRVVSFDGSRFALDELVIERR